MEDNTEVIYVEAKRRSGCFVSFLVLLIFTVLVMGVAAIKNPSQAEGKAQVKHYLTTPLQEAAMKQIAEGSDDYGFGEAIGAMIVSAMLPNLIDAMVQVQTTDYIFFTQFKSTITFDNEQKNLMSGIILFGKIIPLSSDINQEKLKELGLE